MRTGRRPVGFPQARIPIGISAPEQHLTVEYCELWIVVAAIKEPICICATNSSQFLRTGRRPVGHPEARGSIAVKAFK
jgi:hypothetical protein